jgi:hypothetical protein
VEDRKPLLVCARCGDRIGVYEPLWAELADGTLHSSSYLNLARCDLHHESRFWHLGCLAPDAVPPAVDP